MSNLSLLNPCLQTLISENGVFFFSNPCSPAQTLRIRFGSSSPRAKSTSNVPLPFIDLHDRRRRIAIRCSTRGASGSGAQEEGTPSHSSSSQGDNNVGFWSKWKVDSAEMRSRIAKLGLAAVLAYGLIDGVTYTTFFVLAFLGYEKSTGKNPAANLQSLLGIVILMWTGNNVTRPFRIAGAAALAPVIDKGLKKIEKYFNLPSQVYAFALVVGVIAGTCLTIVGLLILSRWGK